MLHLSKLQRLADQCRFEQLLDEVLRNGRPLPLAARARLSEAGSVRLASLGLALQRAVELSYQPTGATESLACAAIQAISEISSSAHDMRGLGGNDAGGGERVEGGEGSSLVGPSAGDERERGEAEATAAASHCKVRSRGAVAGREPGDSPPSAGALAAALAGLADVLQQAESSGIDLAPGLPGRLRAAIRAGAYVLFEMQARHAVLQPRSQGLFSDAIDSALALWQVAPRPELTYGLADAVNWGELQRAVERLSLWRDPACGPLLALAEASAATAYAPPSRRPAAA